MVKVGLVGLGKMGQTHLGKYDVMKGIRVTAVADADEDRVEEVVETHSAGKDRPAPEGFKDAVEMMDNADVDVLDFCLPTPVHAKLCKEGLSRGKHVLCEKPMALNSEECEDLLKAAKDSSGLFMVAHCIRFWPEYTYLKETVESGRMGELKNLTLSRISPPPEWSAEKWMEDSGKSGGAILDLHIHDVDFAQFMFGKPASIFCTGVTGRTGGYDAVNAIFAYEDGPTVELSCDQLLPPSRPFEMSYSATFEKGCLVYSSAREPGLMEFNKQGQKHPEVEHSDGYEGELAYFRDCIENNELPAFCSPESSALAVRLVEAERESIESGGTVSP